MNTSKLIIFYIGFFLINIFSLSIAKAQPFPTELYKHNAVRIKLSSSGLSICDANVKPAFEIPANSDQTGRKTYSLHSSSLWLGGVDAGGNLRVAAQTYAQNGWDCTNGPLDPETGATVKNEKYDYLFKLNDDMVDKHKSDPLIGESEILNWPGTFVGNGKNFQLAPYADINKNGIYEPLKGDYPKLKGNQEVFFVYNDSTKHLETGSAPLAMQVHGSYYLIDGAYEWINYTVFVDYYITNYSGRDYKDFYAGIWTDFDLGNYDDDFIGTDTSRNMIFVYNGDNIDEGIDGYGLNPPAMGVILLNNKLDNSIYYNNQPNGKTRNPTVPADYYNLLKGKWLDNTNIKAEGDGTGSTGKDSKFVFPGDVCNKQPWSEMSAKNTPGDRRILGNVYLGDFKNKETKRVSIAYLWSRLQNPVHSTAGLCKLNSQADSLLNWYRNSFFPTLSVNSPKKSSSIQVYPNPSSGIVNIGNDDNTNLESVKAQVFDISGREIISTTSSTFNVFGLAKGLYIVRVQAGDEYFSQKLIVE